MERNLPKRKTTRLREYDYGEAGAYFLTLCTENRKNILSKIVGAGSSRPQLLLNGAVVEKWIKRIPQKYNGVFVDNYVIMPNHIHLLLSIVKSDGRENPSPTISQVVGWLKYQVTKEIDESSTLKGKKIFQRSFFDHIIRGYKDYKETYDYIEENPIKWELDKLYNEK